MNLKKFTLKKHQLEAVEFLKARKRALLGDDTGTGKTLSMISTLNAIDAKTVFIVCPNTIKYQWLINMELTWENFKKGQVIDTRQDVLDPEANVVIINYDLIISHNIYRQFFDKKFEVTILDESHRLKRMWSQRTKVLLANHKLALFSDYVYCITGTPMTDYVQDIFPTIHALAGKLLGKYNNYYAFTERFCEGKTVSRYVKGEYIDDWEAKGASNTEELQKILKDFMIRRKLEDLDSDVDTIEELPSFVHYIKPDEYCFGLVDEEFRKTEQMVSTNPKLSAQNIVALKEFTSIRNKIGRHKIDLCIETLLDELNTSDKTVVFTYHKNTMRELKKILKKKNFNPVSIGGSDSAKKKYEKVKQFCNDKDCRVLIGQIKAIGEGIDGLQLVCNHGIFFEISVTPADVHQAKARLKRIGQTSPVSFSYYIVRKTIEEKIFKLIDFKDSNIKKVIS